jgi:hypothetical protein
MIQAFSRRSVDDSDDGGDACDNDNHTPAAATTPSNATMNELINHCCRLCNKGSCYDDVKWLTPPCTHSFHRKSFYF